MQIKFHPWSWGRLYGSDLQKCFGEVKGEWAITLNNGQTYYGALSAEDLERILGK